MFNLSVFLCVALLCVAPTYGWGGEGHHATAGVAEAFLRPEVAETVSKILHGKSLQSEASWADTIKSNHKYSWSGCLHFINTPAWTCGFDHKRDCGSDMCVAGAISNYTTIITKLIASKELDSEMMGDALRFVDHFLGDIHCPVHVGFGSDRGGNSIHGTYNGRSVCLHSIWDSGLIKTRLQDFSHDIHKWIDNMVTRVRNGDFKDAKKWVQCEKQGELPGCPDEWGNESAAAACKFAYTDEKGEKVQDNFKLDKGYYEHAINALEEQIVKGGLRLAMVLNGIWSRAQNLRVQII